MVSSITSSSFAYVVTETVVVSVLKLSLYLLVQVDLLVTLSKRQVVDVSNVKPGLVVFVVEVGCGRPDVLGPSRRRFGPLRAAPARWSRRRISAGQRTGRRQSEFEAFGPPIRSPDSLRAVGGGAVG